MRQTLLIHDATQTSLLFRKCCMMGKQPDVVSGNHKNAASHLQWELVCQEGAHQVAGVTSQPQQQEPDGDGAVHVARLAGTVVLPAHRKQTDRQTELQATAGRYKSSAFGRQTYGSEDTMKQRMEKRPR